MDGPDGLRRGPRAGTAPVFGVSAATWLVMALNLVSYFLFFLSLIVTLWIFGDLLPLWIALRPVADDLPGRFWSVTIAIAAFVVAFGVLNYAGWINRAVIRPLGWYFYAFVLAVVATAYFAAGPATGPEPIKALLDAFAGLMAVASGMGLIVIAALSVVRVRRSDRLTTLVTRLARRGARPPLSRWRTPRVGRAKGLAIGAAGVLIAVAVLFLVNPKYDRYTNNLIYGLCLGVGAWLVAIGARFLQPDGAALLAADPRQPILYLRSFRVDHAVGSRTRRFMALAGLMPFFIVFRAPLEVRLARHFLRFGPFVAIGVPGEDLPPRGAARLKLSQNPWDLDDSWQEVVLAIMEQSQLILLVGGTTPFVNWELSQIAARGLAGKLVVVFPHMSASRTRDALACIERNFGDSEWSARLRAIGSPRTLRAIRFLPHGEVAVVRGFSAGDIAHHIAVLVAHDLGLAV
jgi:hypothetical protein